MYQAKTLAKKVARELSFRKGEDVVLYDVSNLTPLARFYVVCSADNERKINGLKEEAIEVIEAADGASIGHVEGRHGSSWICIDAHDIVVHIFSAEERMRTKFDEIYDGRCEKVEF